MATALPAIGQSFSREQIEDAQLHLWLDGYDVGTRDGVWGAKSREALKAYERDWELPVTGVLNEDRYVRLTYAHAATKPHFFKTAEGCSIYLPPRARETVSWSGECFDGKFNGTGVRVVRYFRQAEWKQERYEGELKDGKRHGQGGFHLRPRQSLRGSMERRQAERAGCFHLDQR